MTDKRKAPVGAGADTSAGGAIVYPEFTMIPPESQEPIKRLAAFFVAPDPGQPTPRPENLGDPLDYGEFALAVHALQHGASPDDLLKMLAPHQRAAIWAEDPTRPARVLQTSYTLTQLIAAEFPEPDWLAEGLLPAVGLVLLGGRPKRGKSTLARQLTAAIGAGGMFLGRKLKPGRVLYICLEERPKSVQDKMRKLGVLQADEVRFEFAWLPLNGEGLQKLRDYAEEQRPCLVVIDTLSRAYTGKIDWNQQGEVTALLDPLQRLAFDCQCLMIGIDHLGKRARDSADPDPIDDMIASTAKTAIADDVWGLYRKRGEGTTLIGIGRNVGELELRLYFDRDTECYQLSEGPRPDSLQGQVLAYLKGHGRATTKELADALDRYPGPVNEALMQLCDKGIVTKGQRKGRSVYYGIKGESSE